jgi:hypothetical protein
MTRSIKKTPSQVETEELLDLLNQTDNVQESNNLEYKNDILNFISVFNIQQGEETIKPFTLYSIYKVWSKEPITKTQFHIEINKYFDNKGNGYLINRNAIQLTHEAYLKFDQKKRKLKSKFWANHYEDFLLYHSLKNGTFWLEADILYFLYDKYTHERGLDKNSATHMSKDVFFTYSDVFLKYKTTKKGKVYSVTENIKNFFQPGQLQRMKESYGEEKKKAKKSKKSARTPRPRSKV